MSTTRTAAPLSPDTDERAPVPAGIPVSDIDPFAEENLHTPRPFHEHLRRLGPAVYLEKYGVYALPRYQEVSAALKDWQSFESGAGVGVMNFRKETPLRPPSLLLEADPPHHDAPRHVLESLLGVRQLRSLQQGWNRVAEDLVDELLAAGTADNGPVELDAAQVLAEAFPQRVFPDALGLPEEGRENLIPYGTAVFNAFGPQNRLFKEAMAGQPERSAWVGEHSTRDGLLPGGFGMAIHEAADRGDITHDQAPLVVRSLLTAGVDTTVNGLSALLHALAEHPESWARLREDPTLIRRAFDEAVRLFSPVQTFFRTATRDVPLAGSVIPEGEKILMLLGSANTDPLRWDDPYAFDLERDPSGHVGFGMGVHHCVGQHVARAEAEALIGALVGRVSRIEPTGAPHRRLNNTLIAFDHLPVRLTPA
jgi:cytochrome P450